MVSGKPVDPVDRQEPVDDHRHGVDFHWFPLDNPGIVSIPLSFLLGWLGTVHEPRSTTSAKYAEMEVRSLTGVGSEKAGVALTRRPGGPAARSRPWRAVRPRGVRTTRPCRPGASLVG